MCDNVSFGLESPQRALGKHDYAYMTYFQITLITDANIQYPSISAKTSSVFAKLLSHLCK